MIDTYSKPIKDTLRVIFETSLKSNSNGSLYFSFTHQVQKKIYFHLVLDTSAGELDSIQLNWLQNELLNAEKYQKSEDQVSKPSIIIWSHHPLIRVGLGHMEQKYSLKNRQEVEQILKQSELEIKVLSGHFHGERTVSKQNITQMITPSMFQINFDKEKFTLDLEHPGYRMVYLRSNAFETSVRWPDRI
jgi:3',5'-cyclic AMP phosphodiesterase CpdA